MHLPGLGAGAEAHGLDGKIVAVVRFTGVGWDTRAELDALARGAR